MENSTVLRYKHNAIKVYTVYITVMLLQAQKPPYGTDWLSLKVYSEGGNKIAHNKTNLLSSQPLPVGHLGNMMGLSVALAERKTSMETLIRLNRLLQMCRKMCKRRNVTKKGGNARQSHLEWTIR